MTETLIFSTGSVVTSGSLVSTASISQLNLDGVSGSFTGTFIGDGSGVTGTVSASHAVQADNAKAADTASHVAGADVFGAVDSASVALLANTASLADVASSGTGSFTGTFIGDFTGSTSFTGSFTGGFDGEGSSLRNVFATGFTGTLDAVNTVDEGRWRNKTTILVTESVQRTSLGLIFRDQFNRADSADLGNDWRQDSISQSIFDNKFRHDIGGPGDQAFFTGSSAANRFPTGGLLNLPAKYMIQGNVAMGGISVGNVDITAREAIHFRTGSAGRYEAAMFFSGLAVRRIVKFFTGSFDILASEAFTVVSGAFYGERLIIEDQGDSSLAVSGAWTLELSGSTDLQAPFTAENLSVLDAAITQSETNIVAIAEQVGMFLDEYIIQGTEVLVTDLPSGFKARLDSDTAVVESGGSASISVGTKALPFATMSVLDASDAVVAQVFPQSASLSDGWGGDTYAFGIATAQEYQFIPIAVLRAATGSILVLQVLDATNETVTIDGKEYSWQDNAPPLATTDGRINTGGEEAPAGTGSVAEMALNLIAAINLESAPSGGAGFAYGLNTTLHPTVTASAGSGSTVILTAKTPGVAGNSITLAKSAETIVTLSGDFLTEGQDEEEPVALAIGRDGSLIVSGGFGAVSASRFSGTASFADFASTADTASLVAGSGVQGAVSLADTASLVLGTGVQGAVGNADTASFVAGADVFGAVASASDVAFNDVRDKPVGLISSSDQIAGLDLTDDLIVSGNMVVLGSSSLTGPVSMSGGTVIAGPVSIGGPFGSTNITGSLTIDGGPGGATVFQNQVNPVRFNTNVVVINNRALVVGHTSFVEGPDPDSAVGAGTGSKFQVLGNFKDDSSAFIARFNTSSPFGPHLIFGRSRGGNFGAFNPVVDNDNLGGLLWSAADGIDLQTQVAAIKAQVDDAAPTASQIGTELIFSVAPGLAEDDLTEAMRIRSTLILDLFGSQIVSGNLQVLGSSSFESTVVMPSLTVNGTLSLLGSPNLVISDGGSQALDIITVDPGVLYMRFRTTDGSEEIQVAQAFHVQTTLSVTGSSEFVGDIDATNATITGTFDGDGALITGIVHATASHVAGADVFGAVGNADTASFGEPELFNSPRPIKTIVSASTYVVLSTDHTVLINTISGTAVTNVTLPDTADFIFGTAARVLSIIKETGSNDVVLVASESQNIVGDPSATLIDDFQGLTLQPSGTTWFVI